MTTFLDGPAKGVTLELGRAPLFLRVVQNTKTAAWDALDQLDDKPSLEEIVHVYRLLGEPAQCFIDYRGKGGRREGRRSVVAEYKLYVFRLDQAILRDNLKWAEWAEAEGHKVLPKRSLFDD